MAAGKAAFTFGDFSHERSGFVVNIPEISAGNLAATTAAAEALRVAYIDIGDGATQRVELKARTYDNYSSWAALPGAQRELKWLLKYTDDVTDLEYQTEIPCAELTSSLFVPGTDLADLTDADWVAFVAAFEALVVSKDENAITVQSVRLVGRNL